MQPRGAGRQWATAVFIGRAVCYSWHGASALQGKWPKGIGPGDLKEQHSGIARFLSDSRRLWRIMRHSATPPHRPGPDCDFFLLSTLATVVSHYEYD